MKDQETGKNDRGEVSIQSLIIVPVVLSVLLLGVHCVQLIHSGHIAVAAASRGAQVAASVSPDESGFRSVVQAVLTTTSDLGARLDGSPSILMDSSSVLVTVRVAFSGAVPFLPSHVTRQVLVPKEQFLREVDR